MLCIEHTFGVDTRGISLVYVLCAKYLKNCSSTNCTKKVQFLHKISLNLGTPKDGNCAQNRS